MAHSFKVVIPARYASTRLPGKPLADIAGKPMVVRVAERAMQSGAEEVIVATDHRGVLEAVAQHDVPVVMTDAHHQSGTDRLAEVARMRGWDDETIVVNVQGDEPLISVPLIRDVAGRLAAHGHASIATACHAIHEREAFRDPNVVKVVLDRNGDALYFSRAPIPYPRDAYAAAESALPPAMPVYRHIGLYAYRAAFLHTYGNLAPAAIEQFEALEQLRALWHGFRITVAITESVPPAGVDTPADLERVRRLFELHKGP